MSRGRLWTLGAILLVSLMVLGVSCQKKVVTMEAAAKPETKEEAPAPQPQAVTPEVETAQPAPAEVTPEPAAPKVEEKEVVSQEAKVEQKVAAKPAAEKAEAEDWQAFEAIEIHFDFDQYVLTPEAMQILDEKAEWLRKHPEVKVLIEGHCDERGSNMYNIVLGENRAKAAKTYLVRSGIDESRLETISYGEEMPLCTEHNESCWWRNRRAHFVIRNPQVLGK